MRAFTFVAAMIMGSLCASCSTRGGESTAADAPAVSADTSEMATFTNVYSGVIAKRCAPCHTVPGRAGITSGKLDMTSKDVAYASLVGTPSAGASCAGKGLRVTAGKPDESILYLKTDPDEPSPCGGKMPLGRPPLSTADANLIEDWIKAGARKN